MIFPIVLFCIGIFSTSAQNARLPDTIGAARYMLELSTDLEKSTFAGKITIQITCLKTTKDIVLNSKELTISQPDVTLHLLENNNPTRQIPIKSQKFDEANDFYTLSIDEDLIVNSMYQIFIPYNGKLRDDSQGFFKLTYTDETGQSKLMALTLMVPNNARFVIPCLDEPFYKAIFQITLIHDKKFISASNMQQSGSGGSSDSNLVTDLFDETPKLSTYVIAFMISELSVSQFFDEQQKISMNIYVRKQFSNQVEFAHKVAMKALAFFSTYFDFKYPNTKLDIGIIPGFPLAGMENFGFINVSESPILLDEATASIFNMYDSTYMICTEVSNQWLGDLVTVGWWDDAWLPMAFGDYFSIIGVDNIFTDWKAADFGFLRKFQNTIEEDSLTTSHPIVVQINDPKDINLYDTITFEKAPYLIRMLNLLLGEDNFKKSIATFIKKYAYATAMRDDLWAIMTDIGHASKVIPQDITIKALMDSWLLQAGFPYISVKVDTQNKKVLVTQQRFLRKSVLQNTYSNAEALPCWMVPLSFTTSKELKFETIAKQWLFCPDTADPLKPLAIPLELTDQEWILFNIKIQVPMQILYEEPNYKAIQLALTQENKLMTPEAVLSRVQLILDTFSFAWQGKLAYKIAFDFVQYLKIEKEYLPWRATLRSLADIRYLLLRTKIFEKFQAYARTLIEPKFKEFGPITELSRKVYIEAHFKTFITFWACSYYLPDCHTQSVQVFDAWMKSTDPDKVNPVPADLKETIYCQGAQVKDVKYWNFLYDRYTKSNEPNELSKISAGLACSLDAQILEKYLEWSLDKAKIRKEESAWVFSSVCDNDIAFDLVKKFLTTRFNDIVSYHNGDPNTLSTYLTAFATLIIADQELTDFQAFWDSHKDKLEKVNRDNIVEKAQYNIAWQKIHLDEISKLFP